MSVKIDDFKNQINADSDEDVDLYFNHAVDYVNFYVSRVAGQFEGVREKQFEAIVDRAVLEVATTLYLKRDGAPVSGTVNSSSLETIMNYGRNFSI